MLKLAKPNWNLSESVQLCSLKLEHSKLGQISANVHRVEGKYLRFKSEIFNSTKEPIGFDEFSMIDMLHGSMSDLYIESRKDLQGKDFGIGKLLRLISVMEMLKNKINVMKLYSVNTAVYFHSKFGFEPKISCAQERDAALFSIAEHPAFKDLYSKAEQYSQNIASENSNPAEMRPKINSLTKEFIDRVLKLGKGEYKNYPFDWGMDMQLSDKKIGEMHEFYNQAYKDCGIDYRV